MIADGYYWYMDKSAPARGFDIIQVDTREGRTSVWALAMDAPLEVDLGRDSIVLVKIERPDSEEYLY